mmetsp:Transcript_3665/g.6799  ORF Transcript_3665/g.6799 Transcript_3665/m.6799 type:complete len:106 (+) Transcript_3665:269-586(+)
MATTTSAVSVAPLTCLMVSTAATAWMACALLPTFVYDKHHDEAADCKPANCKGKHVNLFLAFIIVIATISRLTRAIIWRWYCYVYNSDLHAFGENVQVTICKLVG